MATTISDLQDQIKDVEGFNVKILDFSKKTIYRNTMISFVPDFDYNRPANENMTIAEWCMDRFKSLYHGFDVEVYYNGDRDPVPGNTKLSITVIITSLLWRFKCI